MAELTQRDRIVRYVLIETLKPTDCSNFTTKDGDLRLFFRELIEKQLPIAFLDNDIGKMAIQLHDKEGMSFRKIGKMYGYPESTIRYWRECTLEYAVLLTPDHVKRYILYLYFKDLDNKKK